MACKGCEARREWIKKQTELASDLYKGKFDADVAYAKGDFVSKKGGLWVATAASQGDFSHENWKLVSKNGGEQ